jgi:hypothetical protein
VIEPQVENTIKEATRFYRSLLDLNVAVDILVMAEDTARGRAKVKGTVIERALREGDAENQAWVGRRERDEGSALKCVTRRRATEDTPRRRFAGVSAAAGHGREDHYVVAVFDGGLEALEHSDVLVVQVDVDVAVELALRVEELGRGIGVRLREGAQDLADVRARGLDLGGAAGFRAQDWGDANGRHRVGILVETGTA